jgi:S-adenosyl methyltransferase
MTSGEFRPPSSQETPSAEGRCCVAADGDHPSFDESAAHVAWRITTGSAARTTFAVDQNGGGRAIEAWPGIVFSVRANRAFLARVVRYPAGAADMRQFLNIHTGIPAVNNTHEFAQAVAPGAASSTPTTTQSCSRRPVRC